MSDQAMPISESDGARQNIEQRSSAKSMLGREPSDCRAVPECEEEGTKEGELPHPRMEGSDVDALPATATVIPVQHPANTANNYSRPAESSLARTEVDPAESIEAVSFAKRRTRMDDLEDWLEEYNNAMTACGEPILVSLDDILLRLEEHNEERIRHGLDPVRRLPIPPPECFQEEEKMEAADQEEAPENEQTEEHGRPLTERESPPIDPAVPHRRLPSSSGEVTRPAADSTHQLMVSPKLKSVRDHSEEGADPRPASDVQHAASPVEVSPLTPPATVKKSKKRSAEASLIPTSIEESTMNHSVDSTCPPSKKKHESILQMHATVTEQTERWIHEYNRVMLEYDEPLLTPDDAFRALEEHNEMRRQCSLPPVDRLPVPPVDSFVSVMIRDHRYRQAAGGDRFNVDLHGSTRMGLDATSVYQLGAPQFQPWDPAALAKVPLLAAQNPRGGGAGSPMDSAPSAVSTLQNTANQIESLSHPTRLVPDRTGSPAETVSSVPIIPPMESMESAVVSEDNRSKADDPETSTPQSLMIEEEEWMHEYNAAMINCGEPPLTDFEDALRKLSEHNEERRKYSLPPVGRLPIPPPECFDEEGEQEDRQATTTLREKQNVLQSQYGVTPSSEDKLDPNGEGPKGHFAPHQQALKRAALASRTILETLDEEQMHSTTAWGEGDPQRTRTPLAGHVRTLMAVERLRSFGIRRRALLLRIFRERLGLSGRCVPLEAIPGTHRLVEPGLAYPSLCKIGTLGNFIISKLEEDEGEGLDTQGAT